MTKYKISPDGFEYYHLRNRRIVLKNNYKRTIIVNVERVGTDLLIEVGVK